MDKAAVTASSDHLARATEAVRDIENASTLAGIETAWSDFLTAANRIFSKLEQGAKTNSVSRAWYGRQHHERRTNPLLRYIHHARNVDEHGLAKITERTAPGLALGVGPGVWRFDGTLGPGGQMRITALGGQIPGESKFVESIPSKVRLVKVIDRGDPYDPPRDANAKELLPNEVADLALDYLRTMIEEAGRLLD